MLMAVTNAQSLKAWAVVSRPTIRPMEKDRLRDRRRENVQHIYVMGADGGSPVKISDAGSNVDPTFRPMANPSPSDQIDGAPALYVMDADGKNVRRITQNMVVGGRNDWSPDGKRIAFYAGVPYRRDIFVINADGSGLQQLTNESDNRGPTWSPDGKWIAFNSFQMRTTKSTSSIPMAQG